MELEILFLWFLCAVLVCAVLDRLKKGRGAERSREQPEYASFEDVPFRVEQEQ